jgi:hypothetical protein
MLAIDHGEGTAMTVHETGGVRRRDVDRLGLGEPAFDGTTLL